MFEFDTNLFAEGVSGVCDTGTVSEYVMCVVWSLTAHMTWVGVGWGTPRWDVEGFVTPDVCGERVENERSLVGNEVGW